MNLESILAKTGEGVRISADEALFLLKSPDWTRIITAGKSYRDRLHPPSQVSYTGFRVINYTNYCDIDCSFCSFKDEVGSQRGYTLTLDQISQKTEEALAVGVDQIFIQGGVNPDLPLDWYLEVLELLTKKYQVRVRGFSPIEIKRLADKDGLTLPQLLAQMKAAGLGSVPGAGAEILTDRMRALLSPKKLSGDEFCAVMGACHEAGLPGSVNIVFGSEETPEDIVEHFRLLRDQQDRTQGFLSFIPWVFQPQTKRFKVRHVPGWEYLRLLAISRLFFDNIPHIEVSILVMGKELAEMGLMAGADDINSIVIEENVLRSSGLKTLRAAERFITEAGFHPARRTLNYEFDQYAALEPNRPAPAPTPTPL
jgi:cyclic dehypoxanthinyl futalosine synthase